MASRIIEFFGYDPSDTSEVARAARRSRKCPFIDGPCQKSLSNGEASGACTLKPTRGQSVICCPYRLYSNAYKVLRDVACVAFGGECDLIAGDHAIDSTVRTDRKRVAVFGKRWGRELRLPSRGHSGGYFVDWILAELDEAGKLIQFVAVEVQSIDTTGNYQDERLSYIREEPFHGSSTAGFNWENVNKRILPQLIYKGHVLRRERLCKKGIFFICPRPVYSKIMERLGGHLLAYEMDAGSLTLMWYDIGPPEIEGNLRALSCEGQFTTTVDQLAHAFTAPSNLPDRNVYEAAILAQLG